jgi:flagellar biosynthetic protein FlhB
MIHDILALSIQPFKMASHNQGQILLICFITISAAFAIIAMLDVPYQLHRYAKKLMMTRQDLKDESKESEGNPETKAKIRSIQREMARKRMMAAVPKADVVITNPTHYSVALSYPENTDSAPIVVAKGLGEVALKIQAIAKEHQIMIVESPMLARALYKHTDIDQEIPTALFSAVAQVLAYVFQMRDWKKQGGDQPEFPTKIHVPEELDPLNGSQN